MKGKVLNFIIGVLVGAIIATIGFVIYENNNKHKGPKGMNGGTPPQMMQQNSNSSSEQDTPPALPNGEQPTGNPPSGEAPTGEQTQNNSDTTNTTSNS